MQSEERREEREREERRGEKRERHSRFPMGERRKKRQGRVVKFAAVVTLFVTNRGRCSQGCVLSSWDGAWTAACSIWSINNRGGPVLSTGRALCGYFVRVWGEEGSWHCSGWEVKRSRRCGTPQAEKKYHEWNTTGRNRRPKLGMKPERTLGKLKGLRWDVTPRKGKEKQK